MADRSSKPSDSSGRTETTTEDGPASDALDGPDRDADAELDALRREVEEKYDFDDFGPADMARMSGEEWEAVFDADSWITGPELLERVEADLKSRIATRDVFAVLERTEREGERVLLAYSDEGYAVVYPDGSVEGSGTVLRDVKPTVALCSMDDYEPPTPPENYQLPEPEDVPEGTGQLGNWMLQFMAAAQILAGVGIVVLWLFTPLIEFQAGSGANDVNIVPPIAALAFIGLGIFLFATVANARLSDRFRAEEYRDRLRSVSRDGGRPPIHPFEGETEPGESAADRGREGRDGSGTRES
ncbi:hypothetical protein ACFO0N_12570 [Halobium salinum]|uniref:DUF7319 domain-containing protein n=1 Tax=Halobium salinum TaxID=1364940 RepID=A0ABD5PD48_9EURY|nr:hypothetical protein [Halobium salinum]